VLSLKAQLALTWNLVELNECRERTLRTNCLKKIISGFNFHILFLIKTRASLKIAMSQEINTSNGNGEYYAKENGKSLNGNSSPTFRTSSPTFSICEK
jgi:hypothetical protein